MRVHLFALIMSSAAYDGNVRCACVNTSAGQIVAEHISRKSYDAIRLSFDDRNDLSFGDDVVEFDEDCLDFS
jgi:hypothetical protein